MFLWEELCLCLWLAWSVEGWSQITVSNCGHALFSWDHVGSRLLQFPRKFLECEERLRKCQIIQSLFLVVFVVVVFPELGIELGPFHLPGKLLFY